MSDWWNEKTHFKSDELFVSYSVSHLMIKKKNNVMV